jgi:putative aminopeptidase FrvX
VTLERFLEESLLALLAIDSPTGHTDEAVAFLEKALTGLGVAHRRTVAGALLADLPGERPGPRRALAAHVDTLGCLVKEIKGNGRLKLFPVGGMRPEVVVGEVCRVYAAGGAVIPGTCLTTKASAHVHGRASSEEPRTWDTVEVRLDADAPDAEAVRRLGVRVGDVVAIDARPRSHGGYIVSRYLDDKASVAAVLGALWLLRESGRRAHRTTSILFAVYEEVGHGCPAGLPDDVAELVAVDMAAVGEGQTSDERAVTVCAADASGPYDRHLVDRLVRLAEAEGLPWRVDIYPYYSSDASAAVRAGRDLRHALLGPGVDASHAYERVHLDALVATARLVAAYLCED